MKYYRMKLHYIIHCASMEWQSSDKSVAGSPIFLFFAINMGQSSMDTHVETQPISSWWYTYPAEEWWSSSVGMIFLFPIWWESNKTPWFQSPPTRIFFLPCGKKTPFTLLDLPHPSGGYPTSRKVQRWLRFCATIVRDNPNYICEWHGICNPGETAGYFNYTILYGLISQPRCWRANRVFLCHLSHLYRLQPSLDHHWPK